MTSHWMRALTTIALLSLFPIGAAEVKGQYVYWRDNTENGGNFFRVVDDGTNNDLVLWGFPYYRYDFDPIDRKIYLTYNSDESIRRANHDGSNIEDVFASTIGQPTFIEVDPIGRKIYYYLFNFGPDGPRQLRRVNLDGTSDELVITMPSSASSASMRDFDLHLPSQSIYWMFIPSPPNPPELWRASLDGSNPQMLTTLGRTPLAMSIDPIHDALYWCTEEFDSPIYKMKLSDLTQQPLQIADYAVDLVVDPMGERVYWLDHNIFEIRHMSLDGLNPQALVTETVFPHDINFLPLNDCNANGIDDWCEISCGSAGGYCDVPGCGIGTDANRNGRLDVCDDCNGNGLPDTCDVSCGLAGEGCDLSGCGLGPDCNQNDKLDACDLLGGTSPDCNSNNNPDECDTASASSSDCNLNSVPDECETLDDDCNNNGIRDDCDTLTGGSGDCNLNLVPDECETLNADCNNNGIRDDCDIATGPSEDCNLNTIPDECDPPSSDCNNNGVRDDCDIVGGSNDCNNDNVPDECQTLALEHMLYWADRSQAKIYRSSPTGGVPEQIATTLGPVTSISIDLVDRKIYWCDSLDGRVYRANLDGTQAGEFALPTTRCRGVAVDWQERQLYWSIKGASSNFGAIYRMDLSGGFALELVFNTSRAYGDFGLHGPSRGIYRLNGFNGYDKLNRFNFDEPRDDQTLLNAGPGQTDFVALTVNPISNLLIYSDPSKIYRTDHLVSATSILTNAITTNLAFDGFSADEWIYWSEGTAGRIVRIKANGTGMLTVHSGLADPGPMAFVGPADCNGNGIEDACEISCGSPCGPCDVPGCGTGTDCDGDGRLDACEPASDCDGNEINDLCDTGSVPRADCNYNLVPDDCETDCNSNGDPDNCDLTRGFSADCDANFIPDECDIASGLDTDCNSNVVPDGCEPETYFDCNGNAQRDDCDVAFAQSPDVDADGIPDECRVDPHVLAADPSGINKCRYISIEIQPIASGAAQSAIRVKLLSLHHPDPPYTGGVTVPFTVFEGSTMWAGPPAEYVEASADHTPFYSAYLQCTPHFRDWSTVGLLHVTGATIVPSSMYEVQNVAAGCEANLSGCAAVSPSVLIATTRWGDIEAPFNPPSSNVQPDLGDVSAIVNKFKNAPGAPIKARTLLAESVPSPLLDLSFSQISACVDAFRGLPYPYEPGSCRYENVGSGCGGYSDCGGDGYCSICP